MSAPPLPDDAEAARVGIVRYFQRHIVPILIRFGEGEQRRYALISSFVLSVRDNWMLVTAGHCIRDVEVAAARGETVRRAWLMDTMGHGATHREPLPFDWHAAQPLVPFGDEAHDFGLLFLGNLARSALEANGVEAITEQAWDHTEEADAYFMQGIPGELSEPAAIAKVTAVVLPVTEADGLPDGLEQTEAERWYGHVHLPPGITDIQGMSGGPIFGVAKRPNGEIRYWLHAVQSAWNRGTKAIAACPTRPLGWLLAEIAEGKIGPVAAGDEGGEGGA